MQREEFVLMQFVLFFTPNVVKGGISGFAEVKEHVIKTTLTTFLKNQNRL
jgi:hypothetical protein